MIYIYICINITWDTLHIIFIITIGQMASFETSGIQSLNTGCTAIGFELLRNLDLAGGHSRLCGHGFSFDSSTCYSVHSHCGYMLSLLKDILKKISVWSSKPHGFGRFEEFVDVYMSNSQSNTYDTHSVFSHNTTIIMSIFFWLIPIYVAGLKVFLWLWETAHLLVKLSVGAAGRIWCFYLWRAAISWLPRLFKAQLLMYKRLVANFEQ